MGEAKRRGTREERVAAAIERNEKEALERQKQQRQARSEIAMRRGKSVLSGTRTAALLTTAALAMTATSALAEPPDGKS